MLIVTKLCPVLKCVKWKKRVPGTTIIKFGLLKTTKTDANISSKSGGHGSEFNL